MLNFKDFFEDRLLENLVNESALYFVKDFKDTLYKIRLKDKIAQDLIDVEYTDVKPDMTVISLGDEAGKIKFMQINNFIKAIEKGYHKIDDSEVIISASLEYIVNKAKNSNLSQSELNFFYENPDFEIKDARSRNQADIGRLVNKIFPGKYTDKEREEFVNQFKAALLEEDGSKFELVSGDEIIKWYNFENYIKSIGTLGDSCMRYPRCSDYFEIYTKNPEVCQLLILREGDKILGRALVWNIKGNGVGTDYFMDRVYSINDSTKALFNDWCDKKGYLRKYNYNQSQTKRFLLNGEELYETLEIKLKNWEFHLYPYMDTFKKLDINKGILINDDDDSESGYFILTDTSGGYTDTSGHWSDYYQEVIPEDEAVYSEYLGDWIWLSSSIFVEHGRYDGYYPESYDELVKDPFRGWINKEESYFSEYYGEYILYNDLTYVVTEVRESSDKESFGYWEDSLSSQDKDIIDASELDCYNYLISLGHQYLEFARSILSYSKKSKKYYFEDLSIKVYQTNSGVLSEIDCKILGIDSSKYKSYWTDELAYNFELKDKKGLIKKYGERIKEIELYLSGQQPTIVFSQAQEEELKSKNKNLLIDYKARLSVLKRWV